MGRMSNIGIAYGSPKIAEELAPQSGFFPSNQPLRFGRFASNIRKKIGQQIGSYGIVSSRRRVPLFGHSNHRLVSDLLVVLLLCKVDQVEEGTPLVKMYDLHQFIFE